MAGCGATYESRYWGRDQKGLFASKKQILSAVVLLHRAYMQLTVTWDAMGREPTGRPCPLRPQRPLWVLSVKIWVMTSLATLTLVCTSLGKWGLPKMKDPETGRYLREGKWQIMIHGESYKPIVAEAGRKAASEVYNRIMVTHPLMDEAKPNRVAVRSVSMYVREISMSFVQSCHCLRGGASHIYKPRAVGRGWVGRGSPLEQCIGLCFADSCRCQNDADGESDNLTRFKDGYGPVGAYFLHLKTYTENAYGEEYESKWYDHTKELGGDYIDRHPVPTCLRNHAFLEETKAGRGPIRMVTKEAFQDPHKEQVGWENFLGMTIGQALSGHHRTSTLSMLIPN
ncbi:MAG: hypothetical protein CM1200mP18_08860 [Gammaproteobacteria bacterium]|nr:MAG: hypothetical protein CM1200mP18_08860 [Gammaproteobacteria bacterium]